MAAYRLDGERELRRAMKALPEKARQRIFPTAINAGASIVSKAAKRNITARRHGDLKKSIGVKRAKKPRDSRSEPFAVVGARKGRKRIVDGQTVDPARYAHLVEKGVAPHMITKVGGFLASGTQVFGTVVSHPGFSPKPFLGPAVRSTSNEVSKRIMERSWKGIRREAEKQARKTRR